MKKNKMIVFKKNQVVTMALISILVIAGYLNYTNPPGDIAETKEAISGEVSPKEQEDIPEVENYGEVKFVSATQDENKLKKEKERSKAIEIYREINESNIADEAQKKNAVEKMEKIASAITSEAAIESALSGRGFKNPQVTVGDENVYVSVAADKLNSQELAIISGIIIEELGVRSDKIRVSCNQ